MAHQLVEEGPSFTVEGISALPGKRSTCCCVAKRPCRRGRLRDSAALIIRVEKLSKRFPEAVAPSVTICMPIPRCAT